MTGTQENVPLATTGAPVVTPQVTVRTKRDRIRALVLSGLGFLTVSYNMFIINLVMLILGCIYYSPVLGGDNYVPLYLDCIIKIAALVGILIGQLFFGSMADRFGRTRINMYVLLIMFVCAIASSVSAGTLSGLTLFTVLGIWRLFLGIGIGGDYPLTAVLSSEYSTTRRTRGRKMAMVFAQQGTGILLAACVVAAVLAYYRDTTKANHLDTVWRFALGIGALPALWALLLNWWVPETPDFIDDAQTESVTRQTENVKQIGTVNGLPVVQHRRVVQSERFVHVVTWNEFGSYIKQWKNLSSLIGSCICWFLSDFAFYGINLNQGILLQTIGYGDPIPIVNGTATVHALDTWGPLYDSAWGNIIIAAVGLVPGYWASVFLIDRLGRKMIQFIGFAMLTLLSLIMGLFFDPIRHQPIGVFFVLVILTQFFHNFGPNTTTFIIPGECFETRYRATAHGIAAACGKIGAILSVLFIVYVKDVGGKNHHIPLVLMVFGIFQFIGLLFTMMVPETRDMELDTDLNNRPHIKNETSTFKKYMKKICC
jgi:PHS family inorganic phosphate transporter-like MFS transporter